MKISDIIIEWYKKNRRDLPWRNTADPYRIWLSEIILQQTRVDQGLDYYTRFIAAWPDLHSLASASEQEILKMWQGLGYYSRARNLLTAARQVMNEFNGKFPSNYKDLLSLKGIGPYTAAAIASFTSREQVAVVDGNVARVLSRIYLLEKEINTTPGAKKLQQLADDLLSREDPGTHNQAMMEFGACQCVPASPDCFICPLNLYCEAYKQGRVDAYPRKKKKTQIKERFFTYLVIEAGEGTFIEQRRGNDIWKQLYEFPLIETEAPPGEAELPSLIASFLGISLSEFSITGISAENKHLLSHQTIRATFVQLTLQKKGYKGKNEWIAVANDALMDYPVPRLIDRYLENTEGGRLTG